MGYFNKIVSLYHFNNNALDAKGSNNGDETFAVYTIDSGAGSHALDGNGTNVRVNIGNDSSLDITSEITMGALAKPKQLTYFSKSIINKVNTYYLGIGFPTNDKYGGFVSVPGVGFVSVNAPDAIDTSSYHVPILTFDGFDVKYYLDGILTDVNSAGSGGSIASNPLNDVVIGAFGDESGGFLNAKMDETFIGNLALTDGGMTSADIGDVAGGEVAEVTNILLSGNELGALTSRRRRFIQQFMRSR